MAKKTLSIGGATYDLFVRLPKESVKGNANDDLFSLPLGEKVRVEDLLESCGGGASNTSVGFARLGCDAWFEGVVGSDQWGEKLIANLEREGVHTQSATIVEDEVSSFSIILSGATGERVILYTPGTNTHLHHVTFDKYLVSSMDWIYLNHIQEDSCEIQDDIVLGLTEAREIGLTWNPGGCQIEKGYSAPGNKELLACVNLLLVNKEEALAFSGATTVEGALRTLIKAGAAAVCITDGKHGVIASDGTSIYRCPAVPNTKVIDSTGAGDAFGTGASWALMHGKSLQEALKTGSIQAASVVGALGAETGLLRDTEIITRLQTIDLPVSVDPL